MIVQIHTGKASVILFGAEPKDGRHTVTVAGNSYQLGTLEQLRDIKDALATAFAALDNGDPSR